MNNPFTNEVKVSIRYEGVTYETTREFSTISLVLGNKPFDLIKTQILTATNRILEDIYKAQNQGEENV